MYISKLNGVIARPHKYQRPFRGSDPPSRTYIVTGQLNYPKSGGDLKLAERLEVHDTLACASLSSSVGVKIKPCKNC